MQTHARGATQGKTPLSSSTRALRHALAIADADWTAWQLAELLHLCREGKHQAYVSGSTWQQQGLLGWLLTHNPDSGEQLSSMLVEDSKMGLRRRVGDKFQDSAIVCCLTPMHSSSAVWLTLVAFVGLGIPNSCEQAE